MSVKGEVDTQTIGVLICKNKDNILAKCEVETSTEWIGISEYELNVLLLSTSDMIICRNGLEYAEDMVNIVRE